MHKIIEILPEGRRNFHAWRNALFGIVSRRVDLPKHARHDIYSIVAEDFDADQEIPPHQMGEVWGEATFIIPAGELSLHCPYRKVMRILLLFFSFSNRY
jgi:hypothetical protein